MATIVLRAITAYVRADLRRLAEHVETVNAQVTIQAAAQTAENILPPAP